MNFFCVNSVIPYSLLLKLWKMEHLLQKSKCSIFHNIFEYMIFQRPQKALSWSKGLHITFSKLYSILSINSLDPGQLASSEKMFENDDGWMPMGRWTDPSHWYTINSTRA